MTGPVKGIIKEGESGDKPEAQESLKEKQNDKGKEVKYVNMPGLSVSSDQR